jgi:TRAP-type transport system small permease protein
MPRKNRRPAIKKIAEKIEHILNLITTGILVALMLIVLLQIFTRYILNDSLSWTEEAARYLMIWGVLLGVSVAYLNGYLIAIETFVKKLPASVAKGILILNRLLSLFYVGILIVYGVNLCLLGLQMTSPSLEINYVWIYLAVPVGSVLLFALLLIRPLKNESLSEEKGAMVPWS